MRGPVFGPALFVCPGTSAKRQRNVPLSLTFCAATPGVRPFLCRDAHTFEDGMQNAGMWKYVLAFCTSFLAPESARLCVQQRQVSLLRRHPCPVAISLSHL